MRLLAIVLTWIFGIGLLGCALVIVLTFVDDLKDIFKSEEKVPVAYETDSGSSKSSYTSLTESAALTERR